MIDRKHTQIHIAAFISVLLLIGQFGVLSHSVAHLIHAQEQSCQLFLQCEKSGSELLDPELQLPVAMGSTLPMLQIVSIWISLSQSAYYARAPPSFL
ncbi:MAG: DUF2607 family protein [Pseudomonadales bacterium]|nr:DUF2607 family protein [Pseudomonadales bacterium]